MPSINIYMLLNKLLQVHLYVYLQFFYCFVLLKRNKVLGGRSGDEEKDIKKIFCNILSWKSPHWSYRDRCVQNHKSELILKITRLG